MGAFIITFLNILPPHLSTHYLHRIIVGAPNGTASGSSVDNTGLIYMCPVNPGQCSGLTGSGTGSDRRLFDTAGKASLPSDSYPPASPLASSPVPSFQHYKWWKVGQGSERKAISPSTLMMMRNYSLIAIGPMHLGTGGAHNDCTL